jgi:hypothetical protein
MQEKSKMIQIYKANHKLSLKPSHRDGKHQAPPAKKQNEKNRGVWWKCQSAASLCQWTSSLYLPSQNGLSWSGVSVSCVWLSRGKLGYGLGIRYWSYHTWGVHSCRSHHNLSWFALSKVSGSSSYILSLYGGLCNRRLLVSWPTYKKRSKKMTSTRSAISINPTTHKISIGKPNKIKRRWSRIPNLKLRSVFEVPEDLLNCRLMWRAWGSLKACTKAHGELNVWSCHHEIPEGADHAHVLSLVNGLTVLV